MASMDEGRRRRVADYFLVAGLPQDNPQLLDEDSLEVNLRATANQDPITDITVICPESGENVPDYFQLLDQTPTGLSANLNHGSFRAPEMLLCYRRGRDRPPLLNIGVMYDGKDKMEPDFQVLEFTPNGHSANVNNSAGTATYLTYRRSTEAAPCNQLVVTDVCVIIGSKGEVPPHSFKKIDKTLNKGMLGADVFLCVKRSMSRPDVISYKPGLLSRYPLKDNSTYPLEEKTVPLFCLPMGATLECWPSESTRSSATGSTFVLTLPSRDKVYGAAITFYEEYQESLLTEDQKSMLNLAKYKRKSDRKIFANKSVCLLSQWPFLEAFEAFLFFLYKRQLMGPHDVPLERFVSHFLFDVPFPSPERPRILVQLSADEKVALFHPDEMHLPRTGASFCNMLKNLGADNCSLLLLMVLTEQKILVHSLRPAVMTSVIEALMQIVFPFYWQCPYIPLCPIGSSDFLAAPFPFVIGLDSRFFDIYDPPEDVNAVDLDTNTVTLCHLERGGGRGNNSGSSSASSGGKLSHKLMPKKATRQLRARLTGLLEKIDAQEKLARQMEATNDGAIDFVFKIKKQELELEMEIRESFLTFLVQVLAGYGKFLQPITSAPTVGATDVDKLFDQIGFLKSRDKNHHKFYALLMKTQMFTKFIEERSFVSDTNTALAFFDECIAKYQMETGNGVSGSGGANTNVNSTASNANAAVSAAAAVAAAGLSGSSGNLASSVGQNLRFLELESFDSDRTVLTLPPDASDLPQGSVYQYEKFENLNPDLFHGEEAEHPPPSESNVNGGSTTETPLKSAAVTSSALTTPAAVVTSSEMFETPSSTSTIAKRTKYEIRSAQKSARKNAQDPFSWTLCLLSTTYSLWFIHLPGYLLNSNEKGRALRLGLLCLQRMQRRLLLQSQHIDEICYRVLMQLCGAYGRPEVAVQVLEEMKRSNEIPNAVTYGYYNKAVLECAWPDPEAASAKPGLRLWRKLRLVVNAVTILMRLREAEIKGAFLASVRQYEMKQHKRSASSGSWSVTAAAAASQAAVTAAGSKTQLDNLSLRSSQDAVSSDGDESSSATAASAAAATAVAGVPAVAAMAAATLAAATVGKKGDEKAKSAAAANDAAESESTVVSDKVTQNENNAKSAAAAAAPETEVAAATHKKVNAEAMDEKFRERTQSIVKPTNQGTESVNNEAIQTKGDISTKVVTKLDDLSLDSLGQDKQILESATTAAKKVNRTLFADGDGDGVEEEGEDAGEGHQWHHQKDSASETASSFSFQSSSRKSRSVSVESDGGMVMMEVPESGGGSNLANSSSKLPTVHEAAAAADSSSCSKAIPVPPASSSSTAAVGESAMSNKSGDSFLLLSPLSSPMHRAHSSNSMKIPVTENDPLGALTLPSTASPPPPTSSATADQQKSPRLVKSATCPSEDLFSNAAVNSSTSPTTTNNQATSGDGTPDNNRLRTATTPTRKLLDESEILGSPFSNMTRSTTMPIKQDAGALTPSIGGFFKSFNKTGLTNLKNSISGMSPHSVKIKPMPEALASGMTSIRSAASSLSKKVGELRNDYNSGVGGGGGVNQGLSSPAAMTAAAASKLLPSSSHQTPSGSTYHLDGGGGGGGDGDETNPVTSSDQETWSAFTGQLWDQLWGSAAIDPNSKSNSLSNKANQAKRMFEAFEEFHSRLPKSFIHQVALEVLLTSCSKCLNCNSVLYDEEILAGWSAEDSNLNTRCRFCGKFVVPFLTIWVRDFRASSAAVKCSEAMTYPYLSPLVLRKELENMLEREGDACLVDPGIVDDHPIIFWNLLWYYERIAVKSHLPALCLTAKSLSPNDGGHSTAAEERPHFDHNNVKIVCLWDNSRLHAESGRRPPIYTHWEIKVRKQQQQEQQHNGVGEGEGEGAEAPPPTSINGDYLNAIVDQQSESELKPLIKEIIDGVQKNDLIKPLKSLLEERLNSGSLSQPTTAAAAQDDRCNQPSGNGNAKESSAAAAAVQYRSVYREILFLTLVSLNQDNIDLTAFDRVYAKAFEGLPEKYKQVAQRSDFPPDKQVTLCRKIFRELRI